MLIIQEREKSSLSVQNNGFVPPKYLGWLVDEAQKSLVTISCKSSLGSGFSFYLDEFDREAGFQHFDSSIEGATSVLITNEHVIRDCVDSSTVRITIADETSHEAKIERVDVANDLALLTTSVKIKPISGASWKPTPAYWAMALGSPHNFRGSVTIGTVINLDASKVFHTASLSPGNSGGPLLDNGGYLYGVNSGSKPVGQNFNISVGVNAFCDLLIKCTKSRYWADK
jgi:S1-C subfamily serine protease